MATPTPGPSVVGRTDDGADGDTVSVMSSPVGFSVVDDDGDDDDDSTAEGPLVGWFGERWWLGVGAAVAPVREDRALDGACAAGIIVGLSGEWLSVDGVRGLAVESIEGGLFPGWLDAVGMGTGLFLFLSSSSSSSSLLSLLLLPTRSSNRSGILAQEEELSCNKRTDVIMETTRSFGKATIVFDVLGRCFKEKNEENVRTEIEDVFLESKRLPDY